MSVGVPKKRSSGDLGRRVRTQPYCDEQVTEVCWAVTHNRRIKDNPVTRITSNDPGLASNIFMGDTDMVGGSKEYSYQ